jgi:hypothetical protein
VGNNINANAQAIIEQVFMPMAKELRRYLEAELAKPEATAPASDRVVRLDHNKPEYKEAVESLDKLIKSINETNDYPDIEEKEQRLAEVSAARRLLEATRVRVEALVSLLKPVVMQYAKGVKDNLITIGCFCDGHRAGRALRPYLWLVPWAARLHRATCDRRSWSRLRSRSHVAVRMAA